MVSNTEVITTVNIGNYVEYVISSTGSITKQYYYAGSTRVAIPPSSCGTGVREAGTLYFLLSDHLGSTSLTVDGDGDRVAEMRYSAWGSVRYTSGSTPTDFTYTGQRSETESFGLMFYNARWYDPRIIGFNQPDTLIPDPFNVLDWNRYAYTRYNSIRYIDPSGHCVGILAGIDTVICIDAVIVIGLTAAALAVANPEGAEAAVELIIDGIENATDTVVYLWESTAGTVLEARISKRTLGALNQVANHLSKLNQGASVGGFPGFEPPKGDDDYNKKIEEGNFNAQDVNDWIKDINKHLNNISKYNPNMTLEEILVEAGYSDAEIAEYLQILKNAHATASGMEGYGVTEATVETLEAVMSELGVPIW